MTRFEAAIQIAKLIFATYFAYIGYEILKHLK